MFEFWEWVGGRYSVESAIGLTLISIGPERFAEFLAGSHAVDEHFRTAPFPKNVPVVLAMIRVWNTNVLGFDTKVVIQSITRSRVRPSLAPTAAPAGSRLGSPARART